MRAQHLHAKVSSQITRITTLTCSICSLHKEHSRQIVSTCFNPSCFRVSTCFSCFNKSLFRTHSQSRQGLHQCLNLPTIATYGVITPDMTKQNLYNSQAHSTRSSTITLNHFARTNIIKNLHPRHSWIGLCKRYCESMYDEHMIQKILTWPAA